MGGRAVWDAVGVAAGREIAERVFTSLAGLATDSTGAALSELELADLRRSSTAPDPESAAREYAEGAVSEFTGLLGPYLPLMAIINGTSRTDEWMETGVSEEWIAAAPRIAEDA